jgi:hypothetical protein
MTKRSEEDERAEKGRQRRPGTGRRWLRQIR